MNRLPMVLLIVLIPFSAWTQTDKVAQITDSIRPYLVETLRQKGLRWGDSVFLRVFKQEKQLEVWVWRDSLYTLFQTIPVCTMSGKPGPKRKQGDRQVPEGCYWIDRFHPESNYHLALRVNYPNAADRIHADPNRPGGEIYIHGHCASIGCVAIRDQPIEQLYVLAKAASDSGQIQIPVHIFPCRMELENLRLLSFLYPQHRLFWLNLKMVFDFFETKHQLPNIQTDQEGMYKIQQ